MAAACSAEARRGLATHVDGLGDGGSSAAGRGMANGGVREGWRGERNMMALSVWKEEGPSSGDAVRPSSAMAAMAARVREQQRGEGARERVTESEWEGR